MKTIILVLISTCCLVAGCRKETPGEMGENLFLSTYYDISIEDLKGNDLLDPQNGGITEQDINIYYLIQGERKPAHNGNYDYPEGFFIARNEHTGRYFMRLFVNEHSNSDSISTTYIEFNERGVDTLNAKILKQPGMLVSTTAWYNGELKADKSIQNEQPRSFVIVK